MISLNIGEAVGILESIGSGQDPIIIFNKDIRKILERQWTQDVCAFNVFELDPSQLDGYFDINKKATTVRIKYYATKRGWIVGTLYSMVKERLSIK